MLIWALMTLVLAYGNMSRHFKATYTCTKTNFVAYSGSLLTCLTLPVRPPLIDTFRDLLEREDLTIMISQSNSMMEYLENTQDPMMRVFITLKITSSLDMCHNI